jgi:hypothetical protein
MCFHRQLKSEASAHKTRVFGLRLGAWQEGWHRASKHGVLVSAKGVVPRSSLLGREKTGTNLNGTLESSEALDNLRVNLESSAMWPKSGAEWPDLHDANYSYSGKTPARSVRVYMTYLMLDCLTGNYGTNQLPYQRGYRMGGDFC